MSTTVSEKIACQLLVRMQEELQRASASASNGEDWEAYLRYRGALTYVQSIEMVYGPNLSTLNCNVQCGNLPGIKSTESCSVPLLKTAIERKLVDLRSGPRQLEARIKAVESQSSLEGGDENTSFACQCIVSPSDPKGRLCEAWFDNIIGLQDAKERVVEGFIRPLLYPNLYGQAAKGILLYGPPGTGKSTMAKAMMNELTFQTSSAGEQCARFIFFAPSADMLKGKFVGETEKKIKQIFMGASKLACTLEAKKNVPCTAIIFIDEVDNIAPSRGVEGPGQQIAASSVNALLQMMDGVDAPPNVVVVAATNWPQSLDSAFLRRFTYQVALNLPTVRDIELLLNLLVTKYIDPSGFKKTTSRPRGFITEDKSRRKVAEYCSSASDKQSGSDCSKDIESAKTCARVVYNPMGWMIPPTTGTGTNEEVDLYHWKHAAKAVISGKFDPVIVKGLASKCASRHYSGADVEKMFNNAMRLSANNAMYCQRFYENVSVLGDSVISINSFGTVGVTEINESSRPSLIYIKTMTEGTYKRVANYTNVISYEEATFPNSFAKDLFVRKVGNYYQFLAQFDLDVQFENDAEISKVSTWLEYEPVTVGSNTTWWQYMIGYATLEETLKVANGFVKAIWAYRPDDGEVFVMSERAVFLPIPKPQTISEPIVDFDKLTKALQLKMVEETIRDTKALLLLFMAKTRPDIEIRGKPLSVLVKYDALARQADRSCADMLAANRRYISWDFAPIHFDKAIDLTPAAYDETEFKKFEEYKKKRGGK